jgi:type I restriction enzyme S subunit
MKNNQEFKQTEIGRIPKEWEVVRFGDILTLEYGKGLPERDRLQGKFPVFGSNGVVGFHSQALIKGPGIVIGRKGTIGAVSLINTDFWPIDTTYYIKVLKKEIDLKWLFFALVKLNLPKLSLADVVPGLKRELVYALNLPLPPLPEQKKIAEILSTVDKAVEKVDEAIEKTERLKKGLMQELLTKGIGHKEFKDTEIGRIPKEWEVVRLGDIITNFISGGTPSTKEPSYWNGDIPWITSAYINGFYVSSGEKHISKAGLENSATNIVPKDNILIATRVGIGKVAVNMIDIAISQDLTGALVKKEKVYPNFLCWSFSSPKVQNVLQSFVRGTTIKGIARSELVKIQLPLPPLPEQKKIAEILGTVDKRLELLRKKKEKLGRVKKGLMDDLLSGRRRVKTS